VVTLLLVQQLSVSILYFLWKFAVFFLEKGNESNGNVSDETLRFSAWMTILNNHDINYSWAFVV
jgi:hypothetical protein